MAKGANQKLKLLYLIRIFQEKTDDDHGITMQEIINSLAAYGVTAERKSLYDDFETLGVYGIDINKTQHDRNVYYSIGSREFEVPELKLLVDAVQSSKFITQKKSEELIGKLEKLTSVYEAVKLRRQVYVHGRIKTMNESIYYAVDAIHEAIAGNNQVRFQYFQWNVKKEQELKHNGAYYKVSPWGLSWDDENYYLVSNGIQEIRENGFGRENIPAMMAAVVIISVPLIVLFLIFRDKIMTGVSRGGTKG